MFVKVCNLDYLFFILGSFRKSDNASKQD